eukprot:9978565-Alexandrium_andersonii.AAC.1
MRVQVSVFACLCLFVRPAGAQEWTGATPALALALLFAGDAAAAGPGSAHEARRQEVVRRPRSCGIRNGLPRHVGDREVADARLSGHQGGGGGRTRGT